MLHSCTVSFSGFPQNYNDHRPSGLGCESQHTLKGQEGWPVLQLTGGTNSPAHFQNSLEKTRCGSSAWILWKYGNNVVICNFQNLSLVLSPSTHYVIILDSNTFLKFAELIWCTGTNQMLSKSRIHTFWTSWLAQLHRSIEYTNVFASNTIMYLTQLRGWALCFSWGVDIVC